MKVCKIFSSVHFTFLRTAKWFFGLYEWFCAHSYSIEVVKSVIKVFCSPSETSIRNENDLYMNQNSYDDKKIRKNVVQLSYTIKERNHLNRLLPINTVLNIWRVINKVRSRISDHLFGEPTTNGHIMNSLVNCVKFLALNNKRKKMMRNTTKS